MNGKLLLSIILIGVLLAGCINLGGPAVPTEETKPTDQAKPEVTRPSLNILSPLDDAVVKTEGDFTDIEISIETSNLVVKSPGGKNKVGEGNIVYTLDDGTPLVSVNKKVTLSKVGIGEHAISVEIKQNDQTSYFPKIVKTVHFKVEKISTEFVPKTYEVAINNFAFNPAEITVHVGDSITWKNTDTMPHTASSTGNFDTGTIPSGQLKTITMNKEGTFSYQCTLHPNMKGKVIVVK